MHRLTSEKHEIADDGLMLVAQVIKGQVQNSEMRLFEEAKLAATK